MSGPVLGNVWTDIDPINSRSQERLGYPTQKPEALLDRIITASSNEGDLVLDPFCGCEHARLQLVTIEDLLTGRTIDRPPLQTSLTFKRAPKAAPKVRERSRLDFDASEPDQPL